MTSTQMEILSRAIKKVFPRAEVTGPHMIHVEVGRFVTISLHIIGGKLHINGYGLAGSSDECVREYAAHDLDAEGRVDLNALRKTLEFIKTTVTNNAQQVLSDLK